MSNAVSIQRVTLQEEELTNGEARTIIREIRGSLTETMIAGQGVEAVGIIQMRAKSTKDPYSAVILKCLTTEKEISYLAF